MHAGAGAAAVARKRGKGAGGRRGAERVRQRPGGRRGRTWSGRMSRCQFRGSVPQASPGGGTPGGGSSAGCRKHCICAGRGGRSKSSAARRRGVPRAALRPEGAAALALRCTRRFETRAAPCSTQPPGAPTFKRQEFRGAAALGHLVHRDPLGAQQRPRPAERRLLPRPPAPAIKAPRREASACGRGHIFPTAGVPQAVPPPPPHRPIAAADRYIAMGEYVIKS
jgi:hypothetical protein